MSLSTNQTASTVVAASTVDSRLVEIPVSKSKVKKIQIDILFSCY